MRPICKVCNWAPVERKRKSKKIYNGKTCYTCRVRPWTAHKKRHCEDCGFVAEERCQLDIDHIDGDNKNNDPSNLRTLCANCHRLRTFRERQFITRQHRGLE